MTVSFVLPDADGRERPFGETFQLACDESDSVQVLFTAVRDHTGRQRVRLSIVSKAGDLAALAALDPKSSASLASSGIANGARLMIGFE